MSSGVPGVKAPAGTFSLPVSGMRSLNPSIALMRASSKSRRPLIAAAWLPGWMNLLKMNRRTCLDPAHRFLRTSLASESFAFAVFAASLSARPTKVSIFQSSGRWLADGMFK